MKTLNFQFTALCRLCGNYHRNHYAICAACMDLMIELGPACRYCAIPLPNDDLLVCGPCGVTPPAIDAVYTKYRFIEPLRTLIHAFKYESALYLSSFLTALMLEAKPDAFYTECLLPVPLHKSKLYQRGFNQAAILALELSKILNKPCELFRCDKIIATLPQAGLSAKVRQSNLTHAFRTKRLPYKHITLIDDLYTTGCTANEIAKTLKKQGVERVDIWCCARTCH